ncbi:MAG: glycosyltransferase family 2 protein [Candidatus Margulisiibacteriota bacterium]
MKLSIVIVSWKVKELLNKCLESIKEECLANGYEVFVVDNNSMDGTIEMVMDDYYWVKMIASIANMGFAAGNNMALEQVRGEYILLLNPDTEVKSGALRTLINFLDTNPEAGAVGPKLLNPDGSLQPSCKTFPTISTFIFNSLFLDIIFAKSKIFGRYEMSWWGHDDLREVDQPMGAALMVRKSVIQKIGFMDKRFYMFFDEVDWCYRIKQAGYKIYFTPEAEIIHHGGQSIKSAEMSMSYHWHRSLKRFFNKHYHIPEWLTGLLISFMFIMKVVIALAILFLLFILIRTVYRIL